MNCAIPCYNIVCRNGGKALADYKQQKHCREGQVSILDGSLWLMYSVSSLYINEKVLVNQPICGLSQLWLM